MDGSYQALRVEYGGIIVAGACLSVGERVDSEVEEHSLLSTLER
jgi:hypothetical protein